MFVCLFVYLFVCNCFLIFLIDILGSNVTYRHIATETIRYINLIINTHNNSQTQINRSNHSNSNSASSDASSDATNNSNSNNNNNSNSNHLLIEGTNVSEYILNTIKLLIQKNNPIFLLFTKRIYKLLFYGLLNMNNNNNNNLVTKLMTQYSMNSKVLEINVNRLIKSGLNIFQNHWNIYQNIYKFILKSNEFQTKLNENKNENIKEDSNSMIAMTVSNVSD